MPPPPVPLEDACWRLRLRDKDGFGDRLDEFVRAAPPTPAFDGWYNNRRRADHVNFRYKLRIQEGGGSEREAIKPNVNNFQLTFG